MNNSVCRVCLAGSTGEVKLQYVNNQLLEVYEKLTNSKVSSERAKLCYICLSQLIKCHRFTELARRSDQYLKTVMDTDIKVKHDTVNNLLHIVKLQTLSVTTLKPVYLDGLLRKRPKKTQKTEENKISVTENNELIPNYEIGLVTNKAITKKLDNIETKKEYEYEVVVDKIDDDEFNESVNKTKQFLDLIKYESDLDNSPEKKLSFTTEKITTEEGYIEDKIKESKDETQIQNSVPDGIHENITQVKDYVVINDTELYYECDVCHDIFTTRQELAAHQAKHKTEIKQTYNIEDIVKNLPNTKRPYCPICKKFLAGCASQLFEHFKIHTGERPFICDICGRASRTKHHLQEHIRTHTKEKVFCKVCKNSFTQLSSLGKHMLSHTGQYKHFCHRCGKNFTQSGQLSMHIRAVHEGIRPHCCEVCGKRFAGKSEWRRHMNSHAGIKAFSCNDCGTKVTTNATLKRHKKFHCKVQGLD